MGNEKESREMDENSVEHYSGLVKESITKNAG